MELVNSTPVASRIDMGSKGPSGLRRGLLIAKATFRWNAKGDLELDSQDPFPVFLQDQETPLGTLPRDDEQRADPAFEVALLGRAYAPVGMQVTERRVGLAIGDHAAEMIIRGNRYYDARAATATRPEPFKTIDLTWQNALGGTVDVEIDEGAFLPLTHPLNPEGCGFETLPAFPEQVETLNRRLRCPPGYPRLPKTPKLPNLERIDGAPTPACWAPIPVHFGLHAVDGQPRRHRAHPDWVLPSAPPAGTPIVLTGLTPEGRLELALPKISVHFDYVLGARHGSRELALHGIVLLPEERAFYLVFRLPFQVEDPTGEERGARLRVTL